MCQVTGEKGTEEHHIVYKSRGGKNKANNLILTSWRGHRILHGIIKDKELFCTDRELKRKVVHNEQRFRRRMV